MWRWRCQPTRPHVPLGIAMHARKNKVLRDAVGFQGDGCRAVVDGLDPSPTHSSVAPPPPHVHFGADGPRETRRAPRGLDAPARRQTALGGVEEREWAVAREHLRPNVVGESHVGLFDPSDRGGIVIRLARVPWPGGAVEFVVTSECACLEYLE